MLGSRTTKVVSKRSKDREQNGRQNLVWFDAILIYEHVNDVISMNIINLTTQLLQNQSECNFYYLGKNNGNK